jgi:hypothetical protein
MPYVTHADGKICYELFGAGKPLVFAHGMTISGKDWKEMGHTAELQDRYQVILKESV